MKRITQFLMSVLGFSMFFSCMAKYGAPVALFELKGNVTDETNQPIQNIQIQGNVTNSSNFSSINTDADGNFVIYMDIVVAQNFTYKIKASDLDGLENGGSFYSDSTVITVKKEDFVNANKKDPYDGGTAKKVVNFKLKKSEG